MIRRPRFQFDLPSHPGGEVVAALKKDLMICPVCAIGFVPVRSDQIYCWSTCRQLAYVRKKRSAAKGEGKPTEVGIDRET